MLVTLKELLDQAKVEHKAVGAFNGDGSGSSGSSRRIKCTCYFTACTES